MKKLIRIMAGVLAFLLIAGILWLANGLVGNPISKLLANKSASKYIEERYPEMDLELSKASYDFKSGKYYVLAKSPSSMDTHFSISLSPTGEVKGSSYEDDVLSKFHTWTRVDTEYRKMVEEILESASFPYKTTIGYGEIKLKEKESSGPYERSYGISLSELEIDQKYDVKKLGKKSGHIVLYIEEKNRDAKRTSEILMGLKDLFDKKNVPFYAIDLSLEKKKTADEKMDDEAFTVREFLYRDIYEENFIERLEKASVELKEYYEKQDAKEDKYQ